MIFDVRCFGRKAFRTEPVSDFGPLIGEFRLPTTRELASHRTQVENARGPGMKVLAIAEFIASRIDLWNLENDAGPVEINERGVTSLPQPVFLQLKAIITGELPSLPPQYQPDFPGLNQTLSAVWCGRINKDREHRTRIQNRTLTGW